MIVSQMAENEGGEDVMWHMVILKYITNNLKFRVSSKKYNSYMVPDFYTANNYFWSHRVTTEFLFQKHLNT